MKKIVLAIVAVSFIACKNEKKQIIVLSKGDATINQQKKTIEASNGSGHEEKTFLEKDASATYTVKGPSGEASITFDKAGIYLVNAKADTLLGAQQNYVQAEQTGAVMTQEVLKQKIDSLEQMVVGKNISEANRNFLILPNQAAFLTSNENAIIITPFRPMKAITSKDGQAPEVYRFYSIREVRETIEKLKALTGPTPSK
ncbi:MAG: hypothetical protein MUF12_04960 [Sediminibacterium sp.]|nr:hypothetical protein [Sediminibacterium sp.]